MTDSIHYTREGALARLTFNRPSALNAMGFEMGRRWRDLAHEVTADDSVGAVILDAAGPAFCAGGDVIEMATSGATGADVTAMAEVIHDGIRTFIASDKPIVAAVQGAVAGGGLGLMLTADYIVASDRAKFVSRYANIGLTPDLGVSTLLPAAVGQTRALRLLLQDVTIDAETALDWGLVAEVADDPVRRAAEVAAFWLENATAAFGQAKRLVRAGARRPFAENLDDEARTIGAAFDTDAARTRVAAFAAASARRKENFMTDPSTSSGTSGASLAGKTILMSGGSRGIGLAIALRAARDGANIAIMAKTDTPHPKLEGTVHSAAAAIEAAGGRALPIVGDVRSDDDITEAVLKTQGEFGGIDIVVNNASVIDLSGSLELAAKKYDLMQDVNVRGTFMLSRAALPMLKDAANPHILSLSPPLNITPRWLGAHTGYTLAKFGMTMATLGMAAEFAKDGVAANTLWPETTIATAAVQFALGGDRMMKVSRTPEIYADAAYAVLTRPAREYTGQTLIVEQVPRDAGVTDFSGYAATPGTPDSELFPDIFL